jgi:hypothetical protein
MRYDRIMSVEKSETPTRSVHNVTHEIRCLIGEPQFMALRMRNVVHGRKPLATGVALPICYPCMELVALPWTEKPKAEPLISSYHAVETFRTTL